MISFYKFLFSISRKDQSIKCMISMIFIVKASYPHVLQVLAQFVFIYSTCESMQKPWSFQWGQWPLVSMSSQPELSGLLQIGIRSFRPFPTPSFSSKWGRLSLPFLMLHPAGILECDPFQYFAVVGKPRCFRAFVHSVWDLMMWLSSSQTFPASFL